MSSEKDGVWWTKRICARDKVSGLNFNHTSDEVRGLVGLLVDERAQYIARRLGSMRSYQNMGPMLRLLHELVAEEVRKQVYQQLKEGF